MLGGGERSGERLVSVVFSAWGPECVLVLFVTVSLCRMYMYMYISFVHTAKFPVTDIQVKLM